MKPLFLALAISAFALPLRAETTPLTEPLLEEKEKVITCELTTPPPRPSAPVLTSAKEAQTAVGTYHYKLWLPKGYLADAQKRWPCMFIMGASGNAAMGAMGPYLKSHDFIVVMLVEAKNGPWGPIVGNFLAAHDDVIARTRVAEGRKYATGHSGGARASSVFVQARPGFCGLILQSAGPASDERNAYLVSGLKSNTKLCTVMTMGTADPNKKEEPLVKKVLPAARFEILEFEGGHTAASAELFAQAMDWIDKKNSGPAAPR